MKGKRLKQRIRRRKAKFERIQSQDQLEAIMKKRKRTKRRRKKMNALRRISEDFDMYMQSHDVDNFTALSEKLRKFSQLTEKQDMRGTKSMSDLDRIMYERKPKTHSSGDITEQMVNTLQDMKELGLWKRKFTSSKSNSTSKMVTVWKKLNLASTLSLAQQRNLQSIYESLPSQSELTEDKKRTKHKLDLATGRISEVTERLSSEDTSLSQRDAIFQKVNEINMFLREKVSVTFSISSVIQQADDLLASIKGWSQSEDPTTGEAILQEANDLLSILERGKVTASSDTHVDEVLSEVAKAQDATAAEEADVGTDDGKLTGLQWLSEKVSKLPALLRTSEKGFIKLPSMQGASEKGSSFIKGSTSKDDISTKIPEKLFELSKPGQLLETAPKNFRPRPAKKERRQLIAVNDLLKTKENDSGPHKKGVESSAKVESIPKTGHEVSAIMLMSTKAKVDSTDEMVTQTQRGKLTSSQLKPGEATVKRSSAKSLKPGSSKTSEMAIAAGISSNVSIASQRLPVYDTGKKKEHKCEKNLATLSQLNKKYNKHMIKPNVEVKKGKVPRHISPIGTMLVSAPNPQHRADRLSMTPPVEPRHHRLGKSGEQSGGSSRKLLADDRSSTHRPSYLKKAPKQIVVGTLSVPSVQHRGSTKSMASDKPPPQSPRLGLRLLQTTLNQQAVNPLQRGSRTKSRRQTVTRSKSMDRSLRPSVATDYDEGFTKSDFAIERAIRRRGTSTANNSKNTLSTVATPKVYQGSSLLQPTQSDLVVASSAESLDAISGEGISKPNISSHKKTKIMENAKSRNRRQNVMFLNDGLTAKLFGNKLDSSRRKSPEKRKDETKPGLVVPKIVVTSQSQPLDDSASQISDKSQRKGVRFKEVNETKAMNESVKKIEAKNLYDMAMKTMSLLEGLMNTEKPAAIERKESRLLETDVEEDNVEAPKHAESVKTTSPIVSQHAQPSATDEKGISETQANYYVRVSEKSLILQRSESILVASPILGDEDPSSQPDFQPDYKELRDPKVEVFTRPTVWIDRTEHVPREYVHPHLHPTYCPSWKSTVEAILTIGKKTMTYACRPLTKRVLKKMLATAGLNDSKLMDKVDEMVKCNGRAQSLANRRKELEVKKLSKLGQAKKKLPQSPAGKGKGVINIDGSNLPLTPFISPRTSSALTKHGKTTVTVEQEAQLEQAIWEINSFFFYDIITKYIGTFYANLTRIVGQQFTSIKFGDADLQRRILEAGLKLCMWIAIREKIDKSLFPYHRKVCNLNKMTLFMQVLNDIMQHMMRGVSEKNVTQAIDKVLMKIGRCTCPSARFVEALIQSACEKQLERIVNSGSSADDGSTNPFITKTCKEALQWLPKVLALANVFFGKHDLPMPTRRPPDAAKLAAADTQPLQTKSEVKVQQMERQMDSLKPVVKLRGKLKETMRSSDSVRSTNLVKSSTLLRRFSSKEETTDVTSSSEHSEGSEKEAKRSTSLISAQVVTRTASKSPSKRSQRSQKSADQGIAEGDEDRRSLSSANSLAAVGSRMHVKSMSVKSLGKDSGVASAKTDGTTAPTDDKPQVTKSDQSAALPQIPSQPVRSMEENNTGVEADMLTASLNDRTALSMEPNDYIDSSSYGQPMNQDINLEYSMKYLSLQEDNERFEELTATLQPPATANAVHKLSETKSEEWLRDNMLPPIQDRRSSAGAPKKDRRRPKITKPKGLADLFSRRPVPAPPVPVTSVESYTSLPRVVPSTQSADHPSAEPVSVHDYTVLPPVAPSTSNEYTFNVRMDSLEAKAGKVKGGLLGAQFGSALNIKTSPSENMVIHSKRMKQEKGKHHHDRRPKKPISLVQLMKTITSKTEQKQRSGHSSQRLIHPTRMNPSIAIDLDSGERKKRHELPSIYMKLPDINNLKVTPSQERSPTLTIPIERSASSPAPRAMDLTDIQQLSSHVSSYYRNRELRATLSDTILASRPLSGLLSVSSAEPPLSSTSPGVSIDVSNMFGSRGGLPGDADKNTLSWDQERLLQKHLDSMERKSHHYKDVMGQSDVAMTDLIQALWKENHPTESYEENRSGEWIGRKHHYQPHPDTSLSAGDARLPRVGRTGAGAGFQWDHPLPPAPGSKLSLNHLHDLHSRYCEYWKMIRKRMHDYSSTTPRGGSSRIQPDDHILLRHRLFPSHTDLMVKQLESQTIDPEHWYPIHNYPSMFEIQSTLTSSVPDK